MKLRKTALALACAMVLSHSVCLAATAEYVRGDINHDGKVNSIDLTRLMKHIAGEQTEVWDADIDGNGRINAVDLTRLMKIISGEITVSTDTVGTEMETEHEPETETELMTETETEPVTETETEPVSETETEPVTETETEFVTETETEPVTETETEPVSETETEPVTETETEPVSETETEPVTDPETEPMTETETEPVIETETEPVTETETEPLAAYTLPDYTATYKYAAFKEGQEYAFNGLRGFNCRTGAVVRGGVIYADAEALATIFGLTYKGESGSTVSYEYSSVALELDTAAGVLNAGGKSYLGCTALSSGGRTVIPVSYLASLLGYKSLVSDGIYYYYVSSQRISSTVKTTVAERFQTYEDVICDSSDVVADSRGVGIYEKSPYADRLVGLAYTTWHTQMAAWNTSSWSKPLDGEYLSNDPDVIYRHGVMLAEAGVDFVFVDWSNNTMYNEKKEYEEGFHIIESATEQLFEIWKTIPNAPKICIMVGPGHSGTASVTSGDHQRKVDQVYNTFLANPEYADMYFTYGGKPLLICYGGTPNLYGAAPSWSDSRFTVRWLTGYVAQQSRLISDKTNLVSGGFWSWEERGAQPFTVSGGRVETITCTASYRAQGTEGGTGYIPECGRLNGSTLKMQFQRANDLGAGMVLLVSWNEWRTGEQYSDEISKDLEPSIVHGTFYYDLMCKQIAKYKGKIS